MRYAWNAINTALLFMMFVYVGVTKDINTKANNKCEDLEKKVSLLDEKCDHLSDVATQRDTIVVNIKNYNYYKK